MTTSSTHLAPHAARRAFTLVEMLVVSAIIVLLLGLVVPVVKNMGTATDFTRTAAGIAGTLEQARAYAMANNTYVYVGIGEFQASEPASTVPRTMGVGQIAVAAVAARDGTRGYDVNQPAASWNANYAAAQNGATMLTTLDKVRLYDNVDLADFGDTPPATGNMNRPATPPEYRLGNAKCANATMFSLALGAGANQGKYCMKNVIQFDPQGVARIQLATNSDNIPTSIEIGLLPTHGAVKPALPADQNVGEQAAILLDCLTGSVRVYRP